MGRIRGDLKTRTLDFGEAILASIVRLPNDPRGWVVAKQLGRAATSVGANVWEADAALTDSDFAHKISIARKEASKTEYWLALVQRARILPPEDRERLTDEVQELTRILATIVRKTQVHVQNSRGRQRLAKAPDP
jgi:four helix bundle protein